jgi:RNA polymerase sigma-70 factor, ECF subfamily
MSVARLITSMSPSPSAPAPSSQVRPSFVGDRATFGALVGPLLPQLYRLCLTLCRDNDEADDLLQNSLVKAYTNADSYAGRGDLLGWICGIVRNEHLEIRRTLFRRWSLLDTVLDGCAAVLGSMFTGGSEEPSPEERAIVSQQCASLLECLRAIPMDYRMVVLLCDVEELGYERAAEILGVPIGTVKSRHARGRAKLRFAFLNRDSQPIAEEQV